MNRIQNENHRIGTYEINKIYLSYLDDKIKHEEVGKTLVQDSKKL